MRFVACERSSSRRSSSFRSLIAFIVVLRAFPHPSARTTGARTLGRRLAGERGLDELLDIAVEDPLHVADLDTGPVILHQGVGMEHVAADLATPVGRAQLPALLSLFGLLLEHALLEQPRAQHPHRDLAVLELRPLVLGGRDGARREMGDAHSRLGLVDVLAARAGAAIGVDAELVGTDIDLGLGLHLRRRVDEREGRLAALLEVEWRNPHEPVRAPLVFQIAVRVLAVDRERRALQARLLAGGTVEELRTEPAALGPAEVHPDEHLRPVRGVGAADAGADREECGTLVVGPTELGLEARLRDLELQRAKVRSEVPRDAGILIGERQHLGDLGGTLPKAVPTLDAAAGGVQLPERRLRALPIGPEIRSRGVSL